MPFDNYCAFLATFVLFLFVYNCNSILIKIHNYFFNYQRPPKRQYHLPNEILVNIFRYLHTSSNELRKQKNWADRGDERQHQKTFRSLRLVCFQWN
ncbi:hypothetical protein L596_025312 [Steinernema carpocapsae]|uniref:Uncharacterized protein n=1 Tax=Steinernema carpocapsae TaxID=34508 RepID=A0A4U5M7G9_STECR|nr:hypothetical protein L596_025312 [Steinernema carpocapsae]